MIIFLSILLFALIVTKYLVSEKTIVPLFDLVLIMILIPIGTLHVLLERLSEMFEDLGEFVEKHYPKFGPDLNKKLF